MRAVYHFKCAFRAYSFLSAEPDYSLPYHSPAYATLAQELHMYKCFKRGCHFSQP